MSITVLAIPLSSSPITLSPVALHPRTNRERILERKMKMRSRDSEESDSRIGSNVTRWNLGGRSTPRLLAAAHSDRTNVSYSDYLHHT